MLLQSVEAADEESYLGKAMEPKEDMQDEIVTIV